MNAENRSQIGITGKIIDETQKTLVIKTALSRKRVPKQGCMFRLSVNSVLVDVEGNCIVSRPEDRIKKRFGKW